MTVQIIEVIRRSEQGATKPFICRGDDGEVYFVKGKDAGRRSQICEWIAGKLGLAFGLPIAPFSVVDVPEELMEHNFKLDHEGLGVGPAFASMLQEAIEMTIKVVQKVPASIKRDILAFDWWIRNEDRLLTENGGNPNLLWKPESSKLVVIDHNLAFDPKFCSKHFLKSHVFISSMKDVFGDTHQQHEYHRRFAEALNLLPEIIATIPEEWFFLDADMTVPVNFDVKWAEGILNDFLRNDFWGTQ